MEQRILKNIVSGDDAKKGLRAGVDKCADAVGSTFGYRGRTVLIETEFGMAKPTKDGFETLKSIHLEDPVEAIASEILKEASEKTRDLAGDSTTSTIILAQAFFINSLDAVKNGKSPIDVKHEIEKSRDLVLNYLDSISTPITDKLMYDVALTSANGDEEIAEIVSQAFIKAGENGSVGHFRSESDETYYDYIEGTLVESGYADELFVNTHEDRTCVFDQNPLILISNIEIKTIRQLQPFIEFALSNKRQFVIISEMDFGVKDAIVANSTGINKLPFVVVKPPSFQGIKRRDMLNDLALKCGTQMISTLSGDDFAGREAQFLGTCKKVVVGKTDTIITPIVDIEVQEKVNGKINELKSQKDNSKNQLEKIYLQERISRLSGGVSIIKVGSVIESELKEKIDRVDDAVCAVRSAKEQGVLAGGGTALFSAFKKIQELDEVTKKAIRAPFYKILRNASFRPHFVEAKEKFKINWWSRPIMIDVSYFEVPKIEYPFGYDVKEFKEVNMIEAGIVDSTKAIKSAYENAVSASNTMLMTDNIIYNKRQNG